MRIKKNIVLLATLCVGLVGVISTVDYHRNKLIGNYNEKIAEKENAIIDLNRRLNEKTAKVKYLENSEPKDFDLDSTTIEEKFKMASQIYDVDYKLIYAIARLESGNFTSELWYSKHNPGGITSGSGWASFSNDFEGILEMTRMIKYHYINKGLDTVDKISRVYCPSTAEDWSYKVTTIMAEIN